MNRDWLLGTIVLGASAPQPSAANAKKLADAQRGLAATRAKLAAFHAQHPDSAPLAAYYAAHPDEAPKTAADEKSKGLGRGAKIAIGVAAAALAAVGGFFIYRKVRR